MKAAEQKKEEAEKKKAQQKLFTTAKAAFTKAVDDCKASHDRITEELKTVDKLKEKLGAKPYDTSQVCSFLEAETAKQIASLQTLSDLWKEGRLMEATDVGVLATEKTRFDEVTKAVNVGFSLFVKNLLADMMKLTTA